MKKGNSVIALIVMASACFASMTVIPNAGAATLYVGGAGPGNYTTIQAAIDIANPGDTIYVFNGTYNNPINEYIRINKTLSLVGEDRNTTVIDGLARGQVVYVTADWVNISGFTIRNSGTSANQAGIQLWGCQGCHVANNNIADNRVGIQLHSSSNISLADNVMTGDSIFIDRGSLEHWNTHSIDTSNTVDGKPVHYLKNVVGGSVPLGAGEVILANCTGVTVENQNITNGTVGISLGYSSGNVIANNNLSTHGMHAMDFWYADNNAVVNNSVSDTTFHAVQIYFSKDYVVLNNTVFDNTYPGILLWSPVNVTVEGNNIFSNGFGLSLVDPENVTVQYNRIFGNSGAIRVSGSSGAVIRRNELFLNGGGINLMDAPHITIVENNIFSNSGTAVYISSTTNVTVERNRIQSNGRAMWLEGPDGINVTENIISDNQEGIRLRFADNVNLSGNDIMNNGYGVSLNWSDDNIIWGNDILSNTDYGIYNYRWGRRNTIASNNISHNGGHGLILDGVDYTSVIENDVLFNGGDGIAFEYRMFLSYIIGNDISHNVGNGVSFNESSGIDVINNTLASNGKSGLDLWRAGYNDIVGNTFERNTLYGIYAASSYNNSIFHNAFVDNIEQAYDDNWTNRWDDGYPSGGNYWNDYTGVDEFSGEYQDIPGGDGIGDTPYDVNESNMDRYPLMLPAGEVEPPTNPNAFLSGSRLSNVTITWTLSDDDGKGRRTVAYYRILRGTTYHRDGFGYAVLANVPNGTAFYVDNLAGEGNPENYFYLICAVSSTAASSCTDDQGGKFTRPLASGPNLVSVPLIQSNESIETVLQTVEYDKAWHYDSSSQEWKWHMTSKGYRKGLFNINPTMGIWVNVTENSNLTVAGIVPAQTTIQLHKGWNLVSFPSFNATYAVSDLKADVDATMVEGYDLALPNFLRVLGDAEVLQAGESYWVSVEAEADWIVEVS